MRILEGVKATSFLFVLLLGSLRMQAHERAVFYPAPAEERAQYQAWAKLRFGKVFFSGNTVTVAVADFDHTARKSPQGDVFRIRWEGAATPAQWEQEGASKARFNRIQQEGGRPITTVFEGTEGLAASMPGLGIRQRWLTQDKHLAFDLKGQGRAAWGKLSFQIEGIPATLTAKGIAVEGEYGQALLTAPLTRIKKNGHWQVVPSAFRNLGGGRFGFELPHDAFLADSVWIDPQLVFSGYSGSTADNWGCTATYDNAGNTLLVGIAFDVGFPVRVGSYQRGFRGGCDLGISKFSPDGSLLLASTYLGGSSQDVPHSVVCNASGDLIIFGSTGSANFPVTNGSRFRGGSSIDPYDEDFMVYGAGSDFFVARLSTNLSTLASSTYLGGSANEGVNQCRNGFAANYGDEFRGSVDVDAAGNIYVAGLTYSGDFPLINPVQNTYAGSGDGVICKLNPSMGLQFSTYIGGSGTDLMNSLTIDRSGRVGFCGASSSTNLPTTSRAYQPRAAASSVTFGTGTLDAYAGVFSPGFTRLEYLTYSGSNNYDQAFFCDFDRNGSLMIMGQSTGDLPYLTPSSVGSPTGGLFVQRFDSAGSQLTMSFRFGSLVRRPNIVPTAFQVDNCGQIYFAGWGGNLRSGCSYLTSTTNGLPVSRDAVRGQTDGADFYICVLQPNASGLKYASYIGSNSSHVEHVDGGTSRFDPGGFIYEAVCAGCGGNSDFPTTQGVYSAQNRSDNCNMAAFKVDLAPLYIPFEAQLNPNEVCPGQTFEIIHTGVVTNPNGYVDFGDGTQGPLTASPMTHNYANPGLYSIFLRGEGPGCPNLDTVRLPIFVKEGVRMIPDTNVPYCLGDTVAIRLPDNPALIRWKPSTFLSPDTGTQVQSAPRYDINYMLVYINRTSGCQDSNFVSLKSKSTVTPRVRVENDTCRGLARVYLSVGHPADTTIWTVLRRDYFQDTVSVLLTSSIHDTALLFQTRDGCPGRAVVPLNVDVRRTRIPLTVVKDSLLASCNRLQYRYSLVDGDSVYPRWSSATALLAAGTTFAPDEEIEPGPILLDVFRGGCRDSVRIDYRPLQPNVPNVVTPDNDQRNDRFLPKHFPPSAKLFLYDGWGHRIAEPRPAQEGYGFESQGGGVYYYLIQDPNAGSCRGWVEVVK